MREYICIKDYLMEDGRLAYKVGETYKVTEKLKEEIGWFVLPSLFDETHKMNTDDDFFEHFIDIKKEQKKVLKRLKNHNKHLPWAPCSSTKVGMFLDEFVSGIDVNEPQVITPKDSIVESVIERFRDRSEVGFKKYGTTLDRDDFSLSKWLDEAQQEAMDYVLYLEAAKNKIKKHGLYI
jgi:hypothetical protein